MNKEDREHLKILAIFHFVAGGFVFLASGGVLIYVAFIALFISQFPTPRGTNAPNPAAIGGVFLGFVLVIVLLIWIAAACIIASGWFLLQHRNHLFCLIVAGVLCMNVPLGTILGVFTFIVLLRPQVQKAFEANSVGGAISYDEDG